MKIKGLWCSKKKKKDMFTCGNMSLPLTVFCLLCDPCHELCSQRKLTVMGHFSSQSKKPHSVQ